MSRKSWTVFWLAALLLLFVFNGSLLITDSVESNYALTAKEMVVSGDWLSPQIYGQYWFDKPVFFYWLTALGFKIFGFTEFAARFFPSCFGLAGLALGLSPPGTELIVTLLQGRALVWILRRGRCTHLTVWMMSGGACYVPTPKISSRTYSCTRQEAIRSAGLGYGYWSPARRGAVDVTGLIPPTWRLVWLRRQADFKRKLAQICCPE